jgi:hypothetical protein
VKLIALCVAGSALLVACGGATDTEGSVPTGDAELALQLCASLRTKTNALVDVVNDSVAKIHDLDDDERSARIRDGFVDAAAALDDWEASLADLSLPDVNGVDELRDDLLTSVDAARQELADESQAFEGPLATIPDDEVRGAVGIWQNTIEKVMSLTEPRIEGYEREELQRAFLDEPTCRHVVQPFRLDD